MTKTAAGTGERAAGAVAPMLEVRGLSVAFGPGGSPPAVDGVSFELRAGETAALVGESGCGKSVTALALARLVPEPAGRVTGGEVLWDGRPLGAMSPRELRRLRGAQIAYVFQDPASALNPVLRVGEQVAEALRLHGHGRTSARREAAAWLGRMRLPDAGACLRRYPHELSGGMQQRVVLAMAVACRPRLLVADEPTTALDVTVQAQILELLDGLRRELGMAVLLITHNLGIVSGFAERLMVMYAGRWVEEGPVEAVLRAPRHPYTAALLRAVPRLDGPRGAVDGIPGRPPAPGEIARGCRFAPRCPLADAACRAAEPPLARGGGGRKVRCIRPLGAA